MEQQQQQQQQQAALVQKRPVLPPTTETRTRSRRAMTNSGEKSCSASDTSRTRVRADTTFATAGGAPLPSDLLNLLAPILVPDAMRTMKTTAATTTSSSTAGMISESTSSDATAAAASMNSNVAQAGPQQRLMEEVVIDLASKSAQLVAADLLAMSVRTGLPINIARSLILRATRRYGRQRRQANIISAANNSIALPLSVAGAWNTQTSTRSLRRRRRRRRRRRNISTSTTTIRPHGLRNHGQTCFLNSVLQALASSRPFLLYLESIVNQSHRMEELDYRLGKSTSVDTEPMPTEILSELLLDTLLFVNGNIAPGSDDDDYNDTRSISVMVREILQRVGMKHSQFRARAGGLSQIGTEQQDAQELLQALIGMVEGEESASLSMGSRNACNTSGSSSSGGAIPLFSSWRNSMDSDITDDTSISIVSACYPEDQLLDEYSLDAADSRDGLSAKHPGSLQLEQMEGDDVLTLSEMLLRMGTLQERMEKAANDSGRSASSSSFSRKEEKKEEEDASTCAAYHGQPIAPSTGLNSTPYTNGSSNNIVGSSPSTPVSPLTGWLGSTLQCCACKHVRPITNVPFLEIPIIPTSIGTSGGFGQRRGNPSSPLPACSLYECLKVFTAAERVHDVECLSCSIKSELEHINEEMTLLQGAIESVLARSSRKSSRGDRPSRAEDDVDGLQRELQSLETRRLRLESADVDAIYDDTDSYARSEDNIEKEDEALPPPIRGDASKCLLLSRPPPVFCFHIQRRYYDATSDRMLKAMQIVVFPEVIDLAPFCAYTSNRNTLQYKLMNVIEHRGNAHAGHYVTYRRISPSSVGSSGKEWALVSDENISYVSWENVRRSQAYMLFYETI